jgi:hypothetical protein
MERGGRYPGKKASGFGLSFAGFEGGHGGCAGDGGGEGHKDGEDGGGGLHLDGVLMDLLAWMKE